MQNFQDLGLDHRLISALNEQGITHPSPIQVDAIPLVLEGRNLLAQAKTGTGKTLAFLLPLFNQLDVSSNHIQVLIVTPTRELALQITEEAKKLASLMETEVLAVYGGQDLSKQFKKLKGSISVVIATPGRLLDHMHRETIDLSKVKCVVLDEADQMLHIGFKEEVERILKHMKHQKQVLCFSATFNSKVKKLAYKFMKNPVELTIEPETITLKAIKQKVVQATDRQKFDALLETLENTNPFLGIIFCRTKRRVDKVEGDLSRLKISCNKLHGDMSQTARQQIMKSFREAKFQYLVTTDVAARGIDVTGISHIYNYDIPETSDSYIHRIGRTGRMGKDGVAITFVSPKDHALLLQIEQAIDIRLNKETFHAPKQTDTHKNHTSIPHHKKHNKPTKKRR